MSNMQTSWRFIGLTTFLAAFALAVGCRTTPPPPVPADPNAAGATDANWAQVLRRLDDSGLAHNDQRTVHSPDDIASLKAFFPDLTTATQSSLHGGWVPWIVVHFHRADGTDTWISSDYRLYRVDDGRRGDFVLAAGFTDYLDQLFRRPLSTSP
jgi:hypothetical protein